MAIIKKGFYLIYFLTIYILTMRDGTETIAVENLIRIATSISGDSEKVTVYLVLINLFMFIPLILSISREKNDIYQLRHYILTRISFTGYYQVVFLKNIKLLTILVLMKICAELLFCNKELLNDFSSIILIAKLNFLYYMVGIFMIICMELIVIITSMDYKQICIITIAGLLLIQFFSFRNLTFDYLFVPIASVAISRFATFSLIKIMEIIIALAAVWAVTKYRGNKGDIL